MSLVICSNQESDGSTDRGTSIYDAWSFRNPLSSTMTIPANSQVALQSCKVNVDGRVVFSRNNNRFYHYFGEKLSGTKPITSTTSAPLITTLLTDDERGQVVELSLDDFADRIQDRIRSTTYHPNQKEQFDCSVLRNASGHDFLGFKYNFKQNITNVSTVPGNGTFDNFYEQSGNLDPPFSYNNGVFKRDSAEPPRKTAHGICKRQPFSLTNGSFIVNIRNGSYADVVDNEAEFMVGLSRSVNNPDDNGYYFPRYTTYTGEDELDLYLDGFSDFGFGMNNDGELVMFHNVKSSQTRTRIKEVKYYNNASNHIDFSSGSRFSLVNGSQYTKLGFFSSGEKLEVKAFHNGSKAWRDACVVSEGTATYDTFFKPVNQACWCLHPVIGIGTDATSTELGSTIQIEEFSNLALSTYSQPSVLGINNAGWWELLENLGTAGNYCYEMEMRSWNDPGVSTHQYVGLQGSGGVNFDNIMILEESEIYTPSRGANGKAILGFNNSIVSEPNSGAGTNSVIFESDTVPNLVSSMAMFVRLNNFGQNVFNAHNGNRSKIIAHLPRFDNTQSTGRLYFEPSNLIWIDLDNPGPLQVNEFDISFCYINEQFAEILTGQSIVALYFRKKPKELM
jgi:hypothetical protein